MVLSQSERQERGSELQGAETEQGHGQNTQEMNTGLVSRTLLTFVKPVIEVGAGFPFLFFVRGRNIFLHIKHILNSDRLNSDGDN